MQQKPFKSLTLADLAGCQRVSELFRLLYLVEKLFHQSQNRLLPQPNHEKKIGSLRSKFNPFFNTNLTNNNRHIRSLKIEAIDFNKINYKAISLIFVSIIIREIIIEEGVDKKKISLILGLIKLNEKLRIFFQSQSEFDEGSLAGIRALYSLKQLTKFRLTISSYVKVPKLLVRPKLAKNEQINQKRKRIQDYETHRRKK